MNLFVVVLFVFVSNARCFEFSSEDKLSDSNNWRIDYEEARLDNLKETGPTSVTEEPKTETESTLPTTTSASNSKKLPPFPPDVTEEEKSRLLVLPDAPLNLINGLDYEQILYNRDHPVVAAFFSAPSSELVFHLNSIATHLRHLQNVFSFYTVDCSLYYNKRMCQRLDFGNVLSIRYFREHSPSGFKGDELPLVALGLKAYRDALLRQILLEQHEGKALMLPPLIPLRSEDIVDEEIEYQNVIALDEHNFKLTMKQRSHIHYVLFYDPEIVGAKDVRVWLQLSTEFKTFNRTIHFGMVNCVEERVLCAKLAIADLPMIRYYREYSNLKDFIELDPGLNLCNAKDDLLYTIASEQSAGRAAMLPSLLPMGDYLPYTKQCKVTSREFGIDKHIGLVIEPYDAIDYEYKLYARKQSTILFFYNRTLARTNITTESWQKLVSDMKEMDLLHVGAMDCGEIFNKYVCQKYKIDAYPTVIYFSENSTKNSIGNVLSLKNLLDFKKSLGEQLIAEQSAGKALYFPVLMPYTHSTVAELKTYAAPRLPVLLLEIDAYSVGAVLTLDLAGDKDIYFRYAVNNTALNANLNLTRFPSFYIQDKIIKFKRNFTRLSEMKEVIFRAKKEYLTDSSTQNVVGTS